MHDLYSLEITFQAGNCAYTTREDIAYWGIDELLVEPCCAVKYYSDIEICIKELDTEESEKQREIEREKLEDFGPTWYGKLRKQLWDLFEYPQTSKGAKVNKILQWRCVVLGEKNYIIVPLQIFEIAYNQRTFIVKIS